MWLLRDPRFVACRCGNRWRQDAGDQTKMSHRARYPRIDVGGAHRYPRGEIASDALNPIRQCV
jgi:hypothetical protein